MRIGLATTAEIDLIWPQISRRMQDGCDRTGGATSSSELWRMCRSGNAYLIYAVDTELRMASVWRFETWPSGTVFQCVAICGTRMDQWIAPLAQFAKSHAHIGGADRLIAQGRKGWERALKRVLGPTRVLWQTYEVKL